MDIVLCAERSGKYVEREHVRKIRGKGIRI